MDARFATPADTDALVSLINEAFAVEKFFKLGERTDAADIRAHLESGRFLLLEDATGIVGSIYIEQRGERAYLGMLAVSPRHQRLGIGSRLMAAAEEFCRELGCRWVDISIVDLRQELPAIYERLGYRAVGTAPFPVETAPVNQPCRFILMEKPLGHSS